MKSWHEKYERRLDLLLGYARSKPKYSQDQKEKAVEHHVEHGRCIAFTVKALGYPGRDSLPAWIGELHPEMHTSVVARTDSLARPPAMKKAAVIALCMRQGSAQAVAQELGVCRPTLYNWKNQLLGPEKSASMKRRHQIPPSPEREELERQLESLRRDVHRLKLEHDLLKKANELIKKLPTVAFPRPYGKKHEDAYTDRCRIVAVSFLEAFDPVKKRGPWGSCGPSCGGASCDPV